MEFVTGVTKRDDWCIADLAAAPEHSRGKIRGAVHNIRNMGEISFLILRRYDGLVQCVFEEMNSGFSLRSLKEGATVEARVFPGGNPVRRAGRSFALPAFGSFQSRWSRCPFRSASGK